MPFILNIARELAARGGTAKLRKKYDIRKREQNFFAEKRARACVYKKKVVPLHAILERTKNLTI